MLYGDPGVLSNTQTCEIFAILFSVHFHECKNKPYGSIHILVNLNKTKIAVLYTAL